MSRAARLAPWLAAAAGLAFSLAAFFPGYLTYDSALQWLQARHGQYSDIHPPAMAMLWRQFDRLGLGPGAMLAWHALLYWGGLALLFAALPLRPWLRAFGVLLVGLWPANLGLLPHIWKDIPTAAGFVIALALLRLDCARPHPGWRLGALAALLFACLMRHNAIAGAAPLLLWLVWREFRLQRPQQATRWPTLAVLTLGLAISLQALALLPARADSVRRIDAPWSVVALWDMAAVSLHERRLIFPDGFADPTLTLDELREDFWPSANAPVFYREKLFHSFDRDYDHAQVAVLRHAWLRLPLDHPRAYLAHRARLMWLLFGGDQAAVADHLVLQPGITPMGDNPPLEPNRSPLNRWLQARLDALIDTPFFAGWLYLLAVLALAAVAWRRRRDDLPATLALAAAASAVAYVLPLAVLSGSAEFRYLNWLVQVALLLPFLLWPKTKPPS